MSGKPFCQVEKWIRIRNAVVTVVATLYSGCSSGLECGQECQGACGLASTAHDAFDGLCFTLRLTFRVDTRRTFARPQNPACIELSPVLPECVRPPLHRRRWLSGRPCPPG